MLVRVQIDQDSNYETFRRWEVAADDVVMESPDRLGAKLMDAAGRGRDGVEVSDWIEEQIENPDFGRIAAQAAKQVIVQRVREAERQQVVDAWKDRVGELVTGVVKRPSAATSLSTWAATPGRFIPRTKGIPRDAAARRPRARPVGRRALEPRGPQLFISRAAPGS